MRILTALYAAAHHRALLRIVPVLALAVMLIALAKPGMYYD